MPTMTLYLERQRQGLCPMCGKEATAEGLKSCLRCIQKRRDYIHRYVGTNPWHPGGPGRRPVGHAEPQRFPAWIERGRRRYGLPDAELR